MRAVCDALGLADDLPRRALRDDAPAAVAAFGPEIDDPVGFGHDVEVVLDHDDAVAGVDQPVQHVDQLLDVGHVQADRRLVEHVERVLVRARRGPAARPRRSTSVRTLESSVTSLMRCASPPESVGLCWPEREIAEAHVLQQPQAVVDRAVRGEELDRFVDAHREHFADRLALEAHRERLGVEARAAAHFARHAHVGQEAHLDALHALAFARLAAPAARVEREAARGVAAHARFGHFGEEAAHRVPEADVGRGARARRLADRRLVDFEHAARRSPSLRSRGSRRAAPACRLRASATRRAEVVVQHVARERRLARARNAGDDRRAARAARARRRSSGCAASRRRS